MSATKPGNVDGQRHRTGSRQSGAPPPYGGARGDARGEVGSRRRARGDARTPRRARSREALATTVMSALARGVRIEAMEAHASDPALQEGTFRNDTPRAGFKGLVHAITATFAVRAAHPHHAGDGGGGR